VRWAWWAALFDEEHIGRWDWIIGFGDDIDDIDAAMYLAKTTGKSRLVTVDLVPRAGVGPAAVG